MVGEGMKKKALRKDFFVEVRKSRNRFLSILFIVALGVSFYSGIQSAAPDMKRSGDVYFDREKLMDLKVVSTLGLTEEDLLELEKTEGIETAEGAYMTDVLCGEGDNQKVLHLESVTEEFQKLQNSDDYTSLAAADVKFHDIIYAATDNQRLISILNNLREQMYRYRMEYLKDRDAHQQLVQEHAEILKALAAGDVDRALEASGRHIERQKEHIIGVLNAKE